MITAELSAVPIHLAVLPLLSSLLVIIILFKEEIDITCKVFTSINQNLIDESL